jgi:methionyl-tRNA formyltransferase
MRLIMLGTGPFAVPTLRALAASAHDVALVVTRPPRGRNPQASPLQRVADELALNAWSPDTVNHPDAGQRLSSLEADLLVVCDYGEILRPATLATARLGGVNLHGSLLPKYRGAAPVQWALLRGETETGNSVIQMTPGLDAGPCLGQQRVAIDPDEDAGQLEARLAALGAGLVCEVVDQLAAGTARPIEQDTSQASKAPRLTKEHGAVDWSRSAAEIKNLVRAVRPWPRAYTFWHRTDSPEGPPLRLNIDRVMLQTSGEAASVAWDSPGRAAGSLSAPPGTVLAATKQLVVATGEGTLGILELQPAGKRTMPAAEFLRGNRVAAGDRFGPA